MGPRIAGALLLLSFTLWGQGPTLDGLVRRARDSHGTRTGCLVLDLDSGAVLYHRDATVGRAPASGMKILTAAAVCTALGPLHVCTTDFALAEGVLVVRGSGDPNLIAGTAGDPAKVFARVTGALRILGVTAVRGIRLDRGTFTGPTRPATWPGGQLEYDYCPPTGALVLEEGCLLVRITPRAGPHAAIELLAPPVNPPRTGRISLVAKATDAVFGVRDARGTLQAFGRMYRRAPARTVRAAVGDPEPWFASSLAAALKRAGITVVPGAPARTVAVHRHRSTLGPALQRALRHSSNFAAEQCLRVLGDQLLDDGSLAGGVRALRMQIEKLIGPLPEGMVLLDGSGLSAGNRVSPAAFAATLRAVLRSRHGPFFRNALPVAGRSGTLDDRFVDSDLVGRVFAKTGWIRGTSSLSGVLTTTDGRELVFSIVMSYEPRRNGVNRHLKRLQEQMVAAMEEL